jgi:WD40 repeat protein
LLQTLEGHTRSVNAVTFSPNGQRLASASWDYTVKLWDTTSGALLQTLEGHNNRVTAIAFSPNSQRLASASYDMNIKLWDASGALLQTLEGHGTWVNAVAFSPNGQHIASASEDKTVKLWDAASEVLLQTLKGHSGIETLSFSLDGTSLQTNRGSLQCSLLIGSDMLPEPPLSSPVFVRDQWICHGADKILWLPSDYRSQITAIHGNTIGLGYQSGRVTIISFVF